ncbi:DUF4174 domain-containing protein [Halospina denitrificans]|nr:DUF4174 domain-containing protein [Halospina denitrificans]
MESLSDLQWENRIILVKASSNPEEAVGLLHKFRDGVAERDVLWFVVTDQAIESNLQTMTAGMAESVRQKLEVQPEGASVILVGKDGGIKDRGSELDLERLFSRIDQMPMRLREMREQDEGE